MTSLIGRLSSDLKTEFEDVKGFSVRNLRYMRAFAKVYPNFSILQPPVAKLAKIKKINGNTSRFGMANDEVYSGLPLWDKGLNICSAHIIENSSWIKELKNIHKVHPYYNEDSWKDEKHFAFLFKDDIFEIIATDYYKIETFELNFEQLATEVAKRMNR